MEAVRLIKGFWKDKADLNRDVTMDAVWNRFCDTGRIGAFRFEWEEGKEQEPDVYWDSDVAKWMEAAAFCVPGHEEIELAQACRSLYSDIVTHKMYLTGGIGSTYTGECFTENYDLQNETAYAETCAAIAMVLFCERMLRLDHDAKYADMIERELYNGMLAGMSIDGRAFFYENPLEITLAKRITYDEDMIKLLGQVRLPITQRKEVFDCSCCPPNLNRTLASVERFLYSIEKKKVYINQFADSELQNGEIYVRVKTDYPVSGRIEVCSHGAESVYIRIPGWCRSFSIDQEYTLEQGYVRVGKNCFVVELDMTPEYMMANENLWEDAHKIAVMRGPVVYCAEGIDHKDGLHKLLVDMKEIPQPEESEYFGIPVLKVGGYVQRTEEGLYQRWGEHVEKTQITLIPYYGFANRGESDMKVWLHFIG